MTASHQLTSLLGTGGGPGHFGDEEPTPPTDGDAPNARRVRRASALSALTLPDLLAMDIPERRRLLNPWLRERDLAMIFARRGVGKSYLAHGVTVAVAAGARFLCWEAPGPGTVLLVDGELPLSVLQARLRRTVELLQADPGDRLRVIAADAQDTGIPTISGEQGQAAIEPHLAGVDLVVLDNLSTLCRGGEENAAESWAPIQSWMLSLRRRGIAVLLVHHSGINEGRQRGTSAREDVLDTVIGLKHPSGYVASEGLRAELTFEKSRGLYGEDVEPLEIALHTDCMGSLQWTHRPLEDTRRAKILDMAAEGMKQAAIAAELGVSQSTVSRVLKGAA